MLVNLGHDLINYYNLDVLASSDFSPINRVPLLVVHKEVCVGEYLDVVFFGHDFDAVVARVAVIYFK